MNTTRTKSRKLCFVTIGATAAFDALIQAVLGPAFLSALEAAAYTDLLIQHGGEGGGGALLDQFKQAQASAASTSAAAAVGIRVTGFDFNKDGLAKEMRAAKGAVEGAEGVVISHAGSGSILDAMRVAVPLIVVPNPALLDNHQEELAAELAAQGYAVHGRLGDLAAALAETERLRRIRRSKNVWPPVDRDADPPAERLVGILDDEMGFLD